MKGWLWDRKITEKQAKKILSSPEDERFISLAALLFARNNSPKEVLGACISPRDFCRYWAVIKKRMRADSWNNPRIEFWQAIYESVRDKLRRKGVAIKPSCAKREPDEFLGAVGSRIKALRGEKGMSQKDLAGKMKVSQQIISRIESGRFNVSLGILKKVAKNLNCRIKFDIIPK